ncbi:MAG: hypothetical protein ACOYL6_01710 [Bacteriovoracaceae bacterium]
MGGFHVLKIIHLCSIVFWSSFVFYALREEQIKLRHWLMYFSSFFATVSSGMMLMNTVGLNLVGTGVFPSWVYIKMILTVVLFITGALSLRKKGLKAPWYYSIILVLLVGTTIVSVLKPYL